MKTLTFSIFFVLMYLAVAAQIPVNIGADTTLCSGACITLDPGSIADGYLWSSGDTTQSITYCDSKDSTIVLTVFNTSGQTGIDTINIYSVVSCDSVWPGDANSNGLADVYDILTIGQYFGFTGPARTNATTNWIGQSAADWAGTSVLNYKHADCNGNGVVEYADFDAVQQNHGLTHMKSTSPFIGVDGAAMLSIRIDQDTLYNGDTLTFSLFLEDSSNTNLDIYGIAFDMYYNSTLIDTNFAPVYDYSNCFMGTVGQDVFALEHDIRDASYLALGITRLDQNNTFGRGGLVDISFILIDDIAGKTEGNVIKIESFFLWVTAILKDGTDVPINVSGDSVVMIDSSVVSGLGNLQLDVETRLYPNPTNDKLNLEIANVTGVTEVKVYDIFGKLIVEKMIDGQGTLQFETTDWPNGNYLLQLINGNATRTERAIVAH